MGGTYLRTTAWTASKGAGDGAFLLYAVTSVRTVILVGLSGAGSTLRYQGLI